MSDDVSSDSKVQKDLAMSDKASFRENSTSFQKLLEESSKYRKKDTFPEINGQRPKKLENLSSRPIPDENGNSSEEVVTPRLNRRQQQQGGTLVSNNSKESEQASPTEVKSRYSQFAELPSESPVPPSTPRAGIRQSVQRQVSLPPVAGPDRRKMDDVLMFSRQGSDIHTKLKKTGSNEGYNSAPNSPSLSRGPLSARRGKIDLGEATYALSSPRQ